MISDSQKELFVVRHYEGEERPSIKGNGFDGLEIGKERWEAEEFVEFVNKAMTRDSPKPEVDQPPKVEPVAWRYKALPLDEEPWQISIRYPYNVWSVQALYATPKAEKNGDPPMTDKSSDGLSDEEIVAIRDEHLPNQGERFDCLAFARAAIAADRERRPVDARLREALVGMLRQYEGVYDSVSMSGHPYQSEAARNAEEAARAALADGEKDRG